MLEMEEDFFFLSSNGNFIGGDMIYPVLVVTPLQPLPSNYCEVILTPAKVKGKSMITVKGCRSINERS